MSIKEHKQAKKISFTWRLDPMAHGSMVLLVNEECKLHDKYIAHNKPMNLKFYMDSKPIHLMY